MASETLIMPRAPSAEELPGADQLVGMYSTMQLIRRFEERVNELYLQGRIPSTLHLYIGQEAVATGLCANLREGDYVLSSHRPHGHAIARGVAPRHILAELMGKVTGCCRAKGGSMHVGDVSVYLRRYPRSVASDIQPAAAFEQRFC